MGKYGYMVDGKYVYRHREKQKPYCTYTYTCLNTTTSVVHGTAISSSSTTEYTTTSWESRMSTYQRVTTVKQYNTDVPYQFDKEVVMQQTKSVTATNYCECDCCNDDCCHETIIAAEKEHISTSTKKYNRYIEEEEVEYETTTSSSYEITYESSWSVTESYTVDDIAKKSVFSTTSISPEGRKKLYSTYIPYTTSYESTRYVTYYDTDNPEDEPLDIMSLSTNTYTVNISASTYSDYRTVNYRRTVHDYNSSIIEELDIDEYASYTESSSIDNSITNLYADYMSESQYSRVNYPIMISTESFEMTTTSVSIYNTTLTSTNRFYSSTSRYVDYTITNINTLDKIQVCECDCDNQCGCNCN